MVPGMSFLHAASGSSRNVSGNAQGGSASDLLSRSPDAGPSGGPATTRRLSSLDVVRGLAIVLMALDHGRDFLASGPDLLATLHPESTNLLRFFTRWATHICAPLFVLLTGVSIRLSLERGRGRGQKALMLLVRGAFLVLLELTLVREGWYFGGAGDVYLLQVIWALGVCMAACALFVYVPDWARIVFGLAVCLGHNLLNPVVPADLGDWYWLWILLHEGGGFSLGRGITAQVAYPLLPWLGLMVLGMAAGRLWAAPVAGRARVLAWGGAACLTVFAALRLLGGFGETNPWFVHDEAQRTLFDFLHVTKYPPSTLFLLMTLGQAFLLLALAERPWGWLGRWLAVFGRVPLFFYVTHLFTLHALGIGVAYVRHGHADWLWTSPYVSRPAEGLGVGLGWVYLGWLACVAALYPACRAYGAWRASGRSGWWSSLL